MKNISFFKSVYHAFCGLFNAYLRERNLRVHLCIANLILPFAYAYGLDRTGFSVLILTITVVVSAELMNSAVEKTVDTATRKVRFDAMHAKDFAAAATLVCAVGAVLVGVALFGDAAKIIDTLTVILFSHIYRLIYIALFIIDIVILFYPKFKYERKLK